MSRPRPHHRGRVGIGRIIVLAVSLIALGANGYVYKEALAIPYPVPGLQGAIIVSALWMVAGASGLSARKIWGRYLVLTILYGGMAVFVVTSVVVVAQGSVLLVAQMRPLIVATLIYLTATITLTNSKDVNRLTSRAWE